MVLLQEEQEAVGEPPCLTRCWDELPAAAAVAVDVDMTTLSQFMKLLLLFFYFTI